MIYINYLVIIYIIAVDMTSSIYKNYYFDFKNSK